MFCRFYDLCFLRVFLFLCVLAYRPTLFFPEKEKEKLRKEKADSVFVSGLAGSLSLLFTGSLKFLLHSQFFFIFFYFRFVCVRVLGARHRGRARRRRGCQRVLAGGGGVAKSTVAVFVPRRPVCLETRGKHEWALSGLHL